MANPASFISASEARPDDNNEPWRYGIISDQSLNSTISENAASQIKEALLPFTGVRFRIAQLPSANVQIGVRSQIIRRRLATIFSGLGTRQSVDPQTQDNPILGEVNMPTSVLPEAISVNWKNLAGGGLSEDIYKRLLDLASLPNGWNGFGSLPMNPSSLFAFISFWKKARTVSADPELVLTPNGDVQGEWHKDDNHYLEIEFRSSGKNSFFALIDGRETALEGVAPLEEILGFVMSHRNGLALRWHYEEGQ